VNAPYAAYASEELIVRDHLAIDRTELANERTLLAYARTALAMLIAGASAIHFVGGGTGIASGSTLIAAAAWTTWFGSRRWLAMRRALARLRA